MAPFPHVELYGAHAPLVEEKGVGGLTRQQAPASGQGAATESASGPAANGVSPAPATPAARPLRADAARNRAKVLAEAARTRPSQPRDRASRHGRQIARRAGVGAGTVYRHFPTKEALLQAVVSDRLHSLAAEAEARLAAPGTDPGEAFFGYFIEIIESGPGEGRPGPRR